MLSLPQSAARRTSSHISRQSPTPIPHVSAQHQCQAVASSGSTNSNSNSTVAPASAASCSALSSGWASAQGLWPSKINQAQAFASVSSSSRNRMVSASSDVVAAQHAQSEAITRQLGLTDAVTEMLCGPFPPGSSSKLQITQPFSQSCMLSTTSVQICTGPQQDSSAHCSGPLGSKRARVSVSAAAEAVQPCEQAVKRVCMEGGSAGQASLLVHAPKAHLLTDQPLLSNAEPFSRPQLLQVQLPTAAEAGSDPTPLPFVDVPTPVRPAPGLAAAAAAVGSISGCGARRSRWQATLQPSRGILKHLSTVGTMLLAPHLQSSASSGELGQQELALQQQAQVQLQQQQQGLRSVSDGAEGSDASDVEGDLSPTLLQPHDSLTLAQVKQLSMGGYPSLELESVPSVAEAAAQMSAEVLLQPVPQQIALQQHQQLLTAVSDVSVLDCGLPRAEEANPAAAAVARDVAALVNSAESRSDVSSDTQDEATRAAAVEAAGSGSAPSYVRTRVSFARTIKVRYIPNVAALRRRRMALEAEQLELALAAQRAAAEASAAGLASEGDFDSDGASEGSDDENGDSAMHHAVGSMHAEDDDGIACMLGCGMGEDASVALGLCMHGSGGVHGEDDAEAGVMGHADTLECAEHVTSDSGSGNSSSEEEEGALPCWPTAVRAASYVGGLAPLQASGGGGSGLAVHVVGMHPHVAHGAHVYPVGWVPMVGSGNNSSSTQLAAGNTATAGIGTDPSSSMQAMDRSTAVMPLIHADSVHAESAVADADACMHPEEEEEDEGTEALHEEPCCAHTHTSDGGSLLLPGHSAHSLYPPKLRVKIPRHFAQAWARQQAAYAAQQVELEPPQPAAASVALPIPASGGSSLPLPPADAHAPAAGGDSSMGIHAGAAAGADGGAQALDRERCAVATSNTAVAAAGGSMYAPEDACMEVQQHASMPAPLSASPSSLLVTISVE